eukprot:COSAG02_NODE_10157_length_2007_cov_1.589099_1_plen_563_part_01
MGDRKQGWLCLSADHGNKKLVLRELGEGATPNGEGNGSYAGRTPLGCAAGSTEKQGEDMFGTVRDPLGCMGALLDAGAEPNRPQSKDGMTPLCLGAKGGHLDRVRLLLKRGATPGLANQQTGETPLSLAAAGGHQQVVEALREALLRSDADLSAEAQLPLGSYRLGDAAVETLLRQRLREGCALVFLDLGANDLTRLPAEIGKLANLQTLKLRDNDLAELPPELLELGSLVFLDLGANDLTRLPPEIGKLANLQTLKLQDNDLAELPPELLELQRLTAIELDGNPRLRAVSQIAKEKGTQGVFDYLRDLHDDPQPAFVLKLFVAGSSMAGKSSLLRALMRKADTLTARDERTIGLDIEELVLPDPHGRAPEGVTFLAYDSGGHDEYQEVQQSFHTPNTLYLLLWDISKPHPGPNMQAEPEMIIQKLVRLAAQIQTCAPGSKVLLVGSHADQVAERVDVAERCQHMARQIQQELDLHRKAQQEEVARLTTTQAASRIPRVKHLRKLLDSPLQLSSTAIAVSAKTMAGVDELRDKLVEAAFDKQTFPTFGSMQPGTYARIFRHVK